MEQLDERRLFTYNERKTILKRSYGICACCGKKLTTKTMTVEHVIPLSKGGKNELDNLIALCPDCNKMKGNLLYLPSGFYSALINKPLLHQLDEHVVNWFRTVSDEFNLTQYPLIAPRYNLLYAPANCHNRHKYVFSKQLLYQWSYVGIDYRAEIDAVTGINIDDMREVMNDINGTKDKPIAMYSLRKITTDKILAVVCVQYDIETNDLTIYLAWHDMSCKNIPNILYLFASNILYALCGVANKQIDGYTVATNAEHGLDAFRQGPVSRYIGYSYANVKVPHAIDAIYITMESMGDYIKHAENSKE